MLTWDFESTNEIDRCKPFYKSINYRSSSMLNRLKQYAETVCRDSELADMLKYKW